MDKEEQIKLLETNLAASLDGYSKTVLPTIDQIGKLLNQEYELENNDHVNFLRNIIVTAGVVAPFSLTLLSVQSLEIQKSFLLLGFIILLTTILVALFSSRKLMLGKRYRDTPSLALDYIIAKCSIDGLLDISKPLVDRTNSLAEVQKSIDNITGKFSELAQTNKLAYLRNKLSSGNYVSFILFSFGLGFIIISVVHPYLVNFLSNLILLCISWPRCLN